MIPSIIKFIPQTPIKMKGSSQILWSSLIACVAAVFEGHIYLSDSDQKADIHPPTLSPNTARLLLAQRLGLAEYHELGATQEKELGILNEYGGTQKALFAQQKESHGSLLIVEGVLHPSDLFATERPANLLVSSPPQSAATAKLAADLQGQKKHQQVKSRHADRTILYETSIKDLARNDPSYAQSVSHIKTLVHPHLSSPNTNTILITPPYIHTSASSTYGAYSPASALSRREEAVLSDEALQAGSAPSATLAASDDSPETSSTPLPHGVPPVCHSTLEKLVSTTNNCSGHGTPYKKSSKGKLDDDNADCFACKCHATIRTDEDGKTHTTKWGGAACQKKDVSTEFWLLAGLSIALIAIAGWAVGLLVQIGNEELPGVIGAGVAGPRASK